MKLALIVILLILSTNSIICVDDVQTIEQTVEKRVKKVKNELQNVTLEEVLKKIDCDAENALKEFQQELQSIKEKVKQDILSEFKDWQEQVKETENIQKNEKFMDFTASPSIGDIIKAGVNVVDGADLKNMINHVSHSFNVNIHHFIEIDSNNKKVVNNYYSGRAPARHAPARRAPARRAPARRAPARRAPARRAPARRAPARRSSHGRRK